MHNHQLDHEPLMTGSGVTVTPVHPATRPPRKVAIGSFDGVHAGHRNVIAGCDTVLTFDPHPVQVLRPTWLRVS